MVVKFSEWPTSWKPKLERMTGNVVISEVDVMYVVVRKAEKHVPYGELFLVNEQRDAQFFVMYLFLYLTLYMFR